MGKEDKGPVFLRRGAGLAVRSAAGAWQHYHKDNSPLPANDLVDAAYDAAGGLWLVTMDGRAVYRPAGAGAWRVYGPAEGGLPPGQYRLNSVYLDGAGNAWFGTWGGGALRLEKVPCWVKEMTDEEAFMELVLSNQQSELTPLERGRHAWEAVQKYSRNGMSTSEYAKKVGTAQSTISKLISAFEVYQESIPRGILLEKLTITHLIIVSFADRQDWPWLCEMAVRNELSTRVLEEAVAETKKITVPPGLSEWLDQTELRRQAAADLQRKTGDRWAGVIAKALECWKQLPEKAETWKIDEKTDSAVKETLFLRRIFIQKLKEKEISTQSGCEKVKLEIINDLEARARAYAAWQARKVSEAEAERQRLEEERRRLERAALLEPKVYYKSCLDMSEVSDESIDLIFADPPYGVSDGGVTVKSGKLVSVDKGEWDRPENVPDPESWLKECYRVLKPGGSIYISGTMHNIFDVAVALRRTGFTIQNDIIWHKKNAPPLMARQDMYAPSHETIIFATKGAGLIFLTTKA